MRQINTILLSAVFLFAGLFSFGQASEASVMIDKENRHAVTIVVDQPEAATRDALRMRLERSGLKIRQTDGVSKYKGVILSEISSEKLDIYTKVEPGPNNSSVVYMAVSRGYNNYTNSRSDSSINQNVKTFLESFILDANNHSSDLGITSQMNDITKGEKDYQQLLDDQSDLQKKRTAIDNKLLEIQNTLLLKREDLDKRKIALQGAKDKRSKL